jgi:hypothetical protein
MAEESQGVRLFQATAVSPNNLVRSTLATAKIGEISDFTGPGGAAAVIDVTHLGSTAKEKLIGLRDEGQLSFSLNFNATDVGQVLFIADRAARTKRTYVLKFSSSDAVPHEVLFQGYPMQFSIAGAVDNKVTANAVIEITGPASYQTTP